MDTINSRIRGIKNHFVGDHNGSRKEFAEIIGDTPSKIGNWMRDGYSVGKDVIEKVLNAYSDVRYEWLVNGEMPMLKSEMNIVPEPSSEYKLISSAEELEAIPEQFKSWIKPFYPEMKVGAGMSMGAYRQPTKYFILVPHSEKVEFWAPVEGNSMYPQYNNRDIVGLSWIHFDGVFGGHNYVVSLKTGSAHLKKVEFIKDNPKIINLKSYNPDFSDKQMEVEKIQDFFKVNMHIGFE